MSEQPQATATELDPLAAEAAAEFEQIAAEAGAAESATEPGAPQPPSVETAELLAGLLEPAFQVLAPAWQVGRAECQALGDAWGKVLDYYYPDGIDGVVGMWVGAIGTTAAVVLPRMSLPRKAPPPGEAEPAGGAA